jgi:hypothetical protein
VAFFFLDVVGFPTTDSPLSNPSIGWDELGVTVASFFLDVVGSHTREFYVSNLSIGWDELG